MGADFNITIRYLGDFLFSKNKWGVFPRHFQKSAQRFSKLLRSIAQAITPDTRVATSASLLRERNTAMAMLDTQRSGAVVGVLGS